ncbi:2-dehydropantoate 2-reductase [Microbacterium soli]|uniref:2-dehydropantoate 2-reductase n=2 Tax=Microbacterium soli TaxID=446075 RepID=A0ABP7NC49_9MICO
MTIWVVGAGAIGCMVGARLAQYEDVVLVDGWKEHVDAINADGLRVDYHDETVTVRSRAVEFDALDAVEETPDIVLLSVKSTDTEGVLRKIVHRLGPESAVVSVQNGMNEEAIAGVVGAERTIGAMVTGDSAIIAPGHAAARMAKRRLVIGELDGRDTPRIRALAERLSQSLPTTWTDNIMGQLWTKLVRNCMFNALGALTGLEANRIAGHPVARSVAFALAREAIRVALAEGMTLDPVLLGSDVAGFLAEPGSEAAERAAQEFERLFTALPSVKSSMLQDVLRGRRTEVDHLNGFVVAKGRTSAVSTAVNERVVALVHQVENGSLERGVDVLGGPLVEDEGLLGERAILDRLPAAG